MKKNKFKPVLQLPQHQPSAHMEPERLIEPAELANLGDAVNARTLAEQEAGRAAAARHSRPE